MNVCLLLLSALVSQFYRTFNICLDCEYLQIDAVRRLHDRIRRISFFDVGTKKPIHILVSFGLKNVHRQFMDGRSRLAISLCSNCILVCLLSSQIFFHMRLVYMYVTSMFAFLSVSLRIVSFWKVVIGI